MCSYGDLKVITPFWGGVAVRYWAQERDVKKSLVFSAEEILRYLYFEDFQETFSCGFYFFCKKGERSFLFEFGEY